MGARGSRGKKEPRGAITQVKLGEEGGKRPPPKPMKMKLPVGGR